MAGSLNMSVHKRRKTVQLIENDSYLTEIESKYHCITIKDIHEGIDFSVCVIKGRKMNNVLHLYELTMHSHRVDLKFQRKFKYIK